MSQGYSLLQRLLRSRVAPKNLVGELHKISGPAMFLDAPQLHRDTPQKMRGVACIEEIIRVKSNASKLIHILVHFDEVNPFILVKLLVLTIYLILTQCLSGGCYSFNVE